MSTAYELSKFREVLRSARRVVALTGAGISAESGVPTFRGRGGLWRQHRAQQLATPAAFNSDPALVWQFYAYRRELVLSRQPNAAHYALARAEQQLRQRPGGRLTVITQNIDELHRAAGSRAVIELHGTLFKTKCVRCGDVAENRDSPITEQLTGVEPVDGSPAGDQPLTLDQLPSCKRSGCGGLLRPHVVWFGESLEPGILEKCQHELEHCDLCLVIGTSSIVYPAAMFAPQVALRGVPVAEFNIEPTPSTPEFGFHFRGPCGTTLPEALRFD